MRGRCLSALARAAAVGLCAALLPVAVPTATAAAGSESLPHAAPAVAATVDAESVRAIQRKLSVLGLPVGPVDGVLGAKTRRGLCVWRELTGRSASRRAPSAAEVRAVAATGALTVPPSMVTGLNVSRTCQTMTWVVARATGRGVKRVFPVSTGKSATKTRTGSFRVFRSQNRWANSQEYPSALPNMYRPVYFSGGQAFHGMRKDAWVYDRPASHGCVRMLRADVDRLWAAGLAKHGTRVRVYGDW